VLPADLEHDRTYERAVPFGTLRIHPDLFRVKEELSARLLRIAARRGVSLYPGLTLAAAAAVAPRNLHAVGIGRKIVNGRQTNVACLRFYVLQKMSSSLISPKDRLPDQVDGIPTDVVESMPANVASGAPPCSANRQAVVRPIVPGISAAHEAVGAGTIACFCRSTAPGDSREDRFVLGNNHVFANSNAGAIGDALWQPGGLDGGTAANAFATLHRVAPLVIDGVTPNTVDAAIGRVRPDVVIDGAICSIGRPSRVGAVAEIKVRKHGRTTGYTEGIITDVSLDQLVGMDHANPEARALFSGQFRVEPAGGFTVVGKFGDSGSLFVAGDSLAAIGMLIATPPGGEYAVASPFAEIASVLQIELL
jgi:hypothetical protein